VTKTAFIGGSRIFGVRFCTAREINLGTVVCAVPPAQWESSAEDSGLYSVPWKENKFNGHRSVITDHHALE
jgi:hypothetical protein